MDYSQMTEHYDRIMTSGYYDYPAIGAELARYPGGRVLELGVGTGLVIEQVVTRRPGWEITGVDLTASMLEIAAKRLAAYPVELVEQNVVDLSLPTTFDLVFSYGGPWYFVPEPKPGATRPTWRMVSHLRDVEANGQGLARVAAHLPSGSTLLLGIQQPHATYSGAIDDGAIYAQKIDALQGGFRKHYSLTSTDGRKLMVQTTDYRTFSLRAAKAMLAQHGLVFQAHPAIQSPLFLEFVKK